MVTNISYDQLSSELQKQLSEFSTEVTEGLNKAFKEVAEAGVEELQRTRPYHDRTGQYSKNFAVTQRKNARSVTGAEGYTIHNKKRYQITHLLEQGHLTRSGSRAAAFPHWEAAQATVEKKAQEAIERVVRNASN